MKTFLLGALWAACYLYATQRPHILVEPQVRRHMAVRYHSGGGHHAHHSHRI